MTYALAPVQLIFFDVSVDRLTVRGCLVVSVNDMQNDADKQWSLDSFTVMVFAQTETCISGRLFTEQFI